MICGTHNLERIFEKPSDEIYVKYYRCIHCGMVCWSTRMREYYICATNKLHHYMRADSINCEEWIIREIIE